MLWRDKIKLWKSGNYQTYPKEIKKRFFYETYVCDKKMSNNYKDIYIETNKLETLNENYSSFKKYIINSDNKYVTSFNNLSGDTLLIIPIPKQNKDFTTMKDFCDNATITQQKHFWKKVALELETMLDDNETIYVSTHGLGEHYFHLRLDKKPKYYKTKELT